MTVIQLDANRTRNLRGTRIGAPPADWQPDELEELMCLYSRLARRGDASGYDYGATEHYEPQFYILGSGAAAECIRCISRLYASNRAWYVVEDGGGRLLVEGARLRTLVRGAGRRLRQAVNYLVMFCMLCGERVLTAEPFADPELTTRMSWLLSA